MKLSNEERNMIQKFHYLTGEPIDKCRKFFESLFITLMSDFFDNAETIIPFLGNMRIKHIDDIVTSKGKEAVIDIDMSVSKQMKKVVGQIIDGDKSDIEILLYKRMLSNLEETIDS